MANIIRETSRGFETLNLEDDFLSKRKIFLVDAINADTSNEIIKQPMYLECEDDKKEITLYINSPGGEVISGLAIYDYIQLMKAPIKTVCIGTAASMAGILFLSGKKREMYEHTRIMLHDPSYANGDISGKKSHEIKHELDKLDEVRQTIAEIVSQKTGRTLEEVYEVTAEDTYFNVQEAIDFGICTGMVKKNI